MTITDADLDSMAVNAAAWAHGNGWTIAANLYAEDVPALIAALREARALLAESRREHRIVDDPYYQCKVLNTTPDYYGPCDCGADEWNAKVDAYFGATLEAHA